MRAMSASRRVDGSSLQLFNGDSSLAFTLKLFSAANILTLGDEHSLHLQLTFFFLFFSAWRESFQRERWLTPGIAGKAIRNVHRKGWLLNSFHSASTLHRGGHSTAKTRERSEDLASCLWLQPHTSGPIFTLSKNLHEERVFPLGIHHEEISSSLWPTLKVRRVHREDVKQTGTTSGQPSDASLAFAGTYRSFSWLDIRLMLLCALISSGNMLQLHAHPLRLIFNCVCMCAREHLEWEEKDKRKMNQKKWGKMKALQTKDA